MSRRDDDRAEERLLARLRAALRDEGEGEPAEPPADRVREVRAQADAHRARTAASSAGSSARSPRSLPRRRFLALGGLAASAGAAVALGGRALLDDDDQPLPPTETIALTGAPDGVRASAELINHTWGVELLLTISGLQPGRRYDTVYRATDGRELLAGSFLGTGREALCRMNGAVLRDELATIEIRRPDGGTLLSSRLA